MNDPESLHDGMDIVNAEDGRAAQHARNHASDRPSVSIYRVRDLKDVPAGSGSAVISHSVAVYTLVRVCFVPWHFCHLVC